MREDRGVRVSWRLDSGRRSVDHLARSPYRAGGVTLCGRTIPEGPEAIARRLAWPRRSGPVCIGCRRAADRGRP